MKPIRIGLTNKYNIIISTIQPTFMIWYGNYETAISFNNGHSWRIAEGYNTLEEAQNGHEKYSNMEIEKLEKINFID